jgi:multidrug/hemolysin transport system permease protein
MKSILELTKRNLKLFFRSKSEVFFSFLSVIIILGLYVLFLSDVQVSNVKAQVGEVDGIKALVNSWVMSGLIAVSTVTLSLGALGRMVADRQKKNIDEFLVTPIKRNSIVLAYILSTLIITTMISITILIISQIYILTSGGELFTLIQFIKILGIILICVLSSSFIMLFLVSFFKNEQSFAVCSTIVGTLIGFVTGAYIPMGVLPKGIQLISNILPVSQGASLLRKIFLEKPSITVFGTELTHLNEYYKMQGVNLYIGNTELSTNFMIIYIILSVIVFFIINMFRFKNMKNR